MPEETVTSSSSSENADPSASHAALLRQEGKPGEASVHPDPDAVPAKPLPESSPLAALPMQLDVTIPIPRFRVQDLLSLEKGALLESRWPHSEDVPVYCGGTQLVWTEFEVVEHKIAVRVTRLA